jgi:hypothetical protein
MALEWKMLVKFIAIWNNWQPFGISYCQLVHFVVSWYIFPRFGMLYELKSGKPGSRLTSDLQLEQGMSEAIPTIVTYV